MKSPEEIAKALHLCYNPPSSCDDCPYDECKDCVEVVARDAEECIRALVNKLPRWISVEEKLPKRGAIVLCYTKYFYEVLQWDDDAEQWVGQYSVNAKHYVTHWMPLPEPPEED